jgi:hypothetical protein
MMHKFGVPVDDGAELKAFLTKAETRLPLLHDGWKLSEAFRTYATKVVDVVYATEEDLKKDAAIAKYWDALQHSRTRQPGKTRGDDYNFGLPKLTKKSLAGQLSHMMFYVTGYHKLIGSLGDYMEGGSRSVGLVIRPNYNEASVGDMFGQNTLAAFTGFPQIDLINDWSHVFAKANWGSADADAADDGKEVKIVKAMNEWQTDLKDLANQIFELNKKRGRDSATNYFNPEYLDSSIAI